MRLALRGAALAALSLQLASCASFDRAGVREPAPSDITAFTNECGAGGNGGISAQDYVLAGYAYVDRACGRFFDAITMLNKEIRFSRRSLGQANLAANAILQAASVAGRTVNIVATGITLTDQVLGNVVEEFAFAPYTFRLKNWVESSSAQHRIATEPQRMQLRSDVGGYCTAYGLVRAYASLCSISTMQAWVDQAIANAAPPTASTAPATPTTARTAASLEMGLRQPRAAPAASVPGVVPTFSIPTR